MLTPEEQVPERVLRQLRPLLDRLYLALEYSSAKVDDWFRNDEDGHESDPYLRAMMIRYFVREHLLGWRSSLKVENVDDPVEVARPSNVGLHITWRRVFQVRVRMGDERTVPVPTSVAALNFFNQPLFGLDLEILRLFVMWTMTDAGIVMTLTCPHFGELRRRESLRVAWSVPVPHPAAVPVILPPPAVGEDEDVPWLPDDVGGEADTGEELQL